MSAVYVTPLPKTLQTPNWFVIHNMPVKSEYDNSIIKEFLKKQWVSFFERRPRAAAVTAAFFSVPLSQDHKFITARFPTITKLQKARCFLLSNSFY